MAFLPLFSGVAYPRGEYYETITLMRYENTKHTPPRPARKYCYIVKRGDLRKIFANVGIDLRWDSENTQSFWNRPHPVEGQEYGVEICEDDSEETNICCKPVYLVYKKHWLFGRAEAQNKIYSGAITPDQAVRLDQQLRNHDISAGNG